MNERKVIASMRLALKKSKNVCHNGHKPDMRRKVSRDSRSQKKKVFPVQKTMLTAVKNYWHEKFLNKKGDKEKFALKRFKNM